MPRYQIANGESGLDVRTNLNLVLDATDIRLLPDGTIPTKTAGRLEAGALSETSTRVMASKILRSEFSSLEVGPAVRLSEIGGELLIRSAATRNTYTPVLYSIEQPFAVTTGNRPIYNKLSAQEDDFIIESDNSQQTTYTTFVFTPTFDHQTNALSLDLVNSVTNLRVRITSNLSSEDVRYFPSEANWTAGTGINVAAGIQEVFNKDVVAAGQPQQSFRFFVGVNYTFELVADQAVVLRGSGTLPWIRADIQRSTTTAIADLSDLDQPRQSITSNITITSANLETYNKAIIFTPSTQTTEVSITITQGLTDLNFFDVCVLGTAPLRIITQGAERVNGETDIRFTNLEGGRIKQVEAGFYSLIFDNTDPDMIDDYIDNARLDGNNLILENSNTNIADLTVDLSSVSGVITLTPQTFTITGVQNYGSEVSGGIFILQSTVTAFDLTIGATTSDGFFAIANGNTSVIEFDISAVPASFGGDGLVSPQAYNIPGSSTVFFYTSSNVIYPVGSTALGTAVGDHPVILTRDTPSLATLNALAQASFNDNSALWVVASDQIAATESGVDSSIMIRALEAGLLDSLGAEISTTAVQKSTVTLAGGTIVRIFSSTDLRVVSAPSPGAMRQLYPDIAFTGALRLEESDEGLYNSYLRRTATNAGGANQYIAMPNLNPVHRPSWVREGDVFVMRHTGSTTGNLRPHFRPDNLGDNIAGHGTSYFANPGATIAIQAPRVGVRTWQLFPVAQMSDGNTYFSPETMLPSQFYIDETDSKALDNSLRLHIKEELVDGLVRDHVLSASATNNPVSLIFEKKNDQDAIAWIQWWSTINPSVPVLGTTVEEIKTTIPTALNYINNTISSSYDFELVDPSTLISIDYVTHQTGDTLKIGLATALPSHIVLLDVITINSNSVAANNGDWAITQIYGDRLAIDITIPGSTSANNTAASGFIDRTLYCRTVVKSETFRQHNFDMYRNTARNNPVTSFLPDWFDIDSETMPPNSILSIGYNTDIQATESFLAIQDDSGNFFSTLGGPRGQIHYLDNVGGNYQNIRDLPLNFEDIHIRTDGTCDFYFNLRPPDLPSGERRRYTIYSDAANDDDDVDILVGSVGSTYNSDEGLSIYGVRNGVRQDVEIYNDGNRHGWRLVSPFSRRMPSTAVTTVTTVSSGIQTMSIAEIVAAQNEDPGFRLMTVSGNKFVLKGNFDYDVEYIIKLRFDGAEDTGLSFVNCELVPILTRAGSTTDITQATGNLSSSIFFIRNGNSADDDTKPIITLNARVRHQGLTNDEIGFDLRFGAFPAGYSQSDLRLIHRQYSIQVTGGIE